MTKKHFIAAAEIVKDFRCLGADKQELELLITSYISFFQKFNDKFDEDRFRAYCLGK